jgi:hypothetical protein
MKMKEFEVSNGEEFDNMIESGNLEISKALVETILKNLKGKKRHYHAMSVALQEEEMVFDLTVDRNDFIFVLETHLPRYEQFELYEQCGEIVKAITYLKDKNK